MNYYIYGYSDTGSHRDHNEDSILIDHEVIYNGSFESTVCAPFITAVCDGVGGENAGELASKLCLQYLSILDYNANVDMTKTIMDIHNKIKKKGISAENAANMQTTLCALTVDEEENATCVNVGDSRFYRYVNGTIRQISTDQSYGQFLYEHGKIDTLDDLNPQYQNAIISSIGSTLNDPEIIQTPLIDKFGEEPDDMVIIVSDGISDHISDKEFEVGLSLDMPIAEKLEAIAQLAIMNGSSDNVSIIGIKPYLDDEELSTLTKHENVEETVDINQILKDRNNMNDILSINMNEYIKLPEEKGKSIDFKSVTDDLLDQARSSLQELEKMFDN